MEDKRENRIKFYKSNKWINLVNIIKLKANYTCSVCNELKFSTSELIGHHVIELNEINVLNPAISLNPSNIAVLCQKCHNVEHGRFINKKVFIVHGSPLSGKREFVQKIYNSNDIIIDIKRIFDCLGNNNQQLKYNAFKIKNELIEDVKRRFGNWNNAFIIGGYPNSIERDTLARRLNAKLIHIETSKEDCIKKADGDAEKIEWINQYWGIYPPHI